MTTVDRDAVLDRTDLAALATEICGDPQGRGRGARWHCPNPAHPDEHPSMGIYQGFQGAVGGGNATPAAKAAPPSTCS